MFFVVAVVVVVVVAVVVVFVVSIVVYQRCVSGHCRLLRDCGTSGGMIAICKLANAHARSIRSSYRFNSSSRKEPRMPLIDNEHPA